MVYQFNLYVSVGRDSKSSKVLLRGLDLFTYGVGSNYNDICDILCSLAKISKDEFAKNRHTEGQLSHLINVASFRVLRQLHGWSVNLVLNSLVRSIDALKKLGIRAFSSPVDDHVCSKLAPYQVVQNFKGRLEHLHRKLSEVCGELPFAKQDYYLIVDSEHVPERLWDNTPYAFETTILCRNNKEDDKEPYPEYQDDDVPMMTGHEKKDEKKNVKSAADNCCTSEFHPKSAITCVDWTPELLKVRGYPVIMSDKSGPYALCCDVKYGDLRVTTFDDALYISHKAHGAGLYDIFVNWNTIAFKLNGAP